MMVMKSALLKLIRKRLGFSEIVDFLFDRKFHDKNRCARCGSQQIYFKIVLERWVRDKLVSRVVIPYCKECGLKELSVF